MQKAFFGNARRSTSVLLCAAAIFMMLCGCQHTETVRADPEKLASLGEIHLVAREDGSGTRTAFAQLLGFDTASANGASDLTSSTAEIAEGTAEVIATVSASESAIGYVSGASLTDADDVKVLQVDGYDIESEKYPLERTFYLTYLGSLDSLQEDFLRFVTSAGQRIVAASYESVSASSTFLSAKPTGMLTIGGSTSAEPLLRELAESYMERNPNVEITVIGTDSTDGLTNAMAGTYDFGMASRELATYESALLEQTPIAVDKIAVIFSADNPLESISSEMLCNVYTAVRFRHGTALLLSNN
ncbi:MAG: substrate-binding domain-containing protein [Ruminococcus sp.]|nr:substrate-binding domain-containing protein [Ruminococcus sp.]